VDPGIALPIGISFYTFQSMSYTIDMYRREIQLQKNFISFGAYVTMFPQIVAGPIVRYQDVMNEIDARNLSVPMFGEGVGYFVRGLAKKVLLANNIGQLWNAVAQVPFSELSAASAWLGILGFSFQIYFDFSGYSDMAIGMGKMLGFNFPANFDLPYISKSISEFWRRWHITLGTWFREYVYIPLGGNRKGTARTVINLLITWMCTGFWHGASWNFLLWGFYFGVLIILERLFLLRWLEKLPGFLRIAYQFILVVFGWVFFQIESLKDVGAFFTAMFTGNGTLYDTKFLYWIGSYWMILLLCIFFSSSLPRRIAASLRARAGHLMTIAVPIVELLGMVLCTAYLVDATFNPFLYFRF